MRYLMPQQATIFKFLLVKQGRIHKILRFHKEAVKKISPYVLFEDFDKNGLLV